MVEDDQASRKALRLILIRQGWDVLVASNLSEARPLLATRPDALILDLMLPDGDGITLLRQVRADPWTIKVVVTTGSSDSSKLEAVRHLKPDVLLFKPLELGHLLEALGKSIRPTP